MNLTELKNTPVSELVQLGESMGLENLARLHKKDIIFAILKAHAKKVALGDDVDFHTIARMAAGASGAELANIVNEAALRAIRDHRDAVSQADLEESIEVVIAGYQKKNAILSDDEKKTVAYHEIGHALVAAALRKLADPAAFRSFVRDGFKRHGFRGRRVVSVLPPGELQVISVDYTTPNGQDDTATLLRTLKDRFKSGLDDAVVDVLPIRRPPESNLRSAVVAVAPRERVIAHLDLLQSAGLEPIEEPIRGGTDGVRLSVMGLPCPNVFTGGLNYHGIYECLPVKSLELAAKVAFELALQSGKK